MPSRALVASSPEAAAGDGRPTFPAWAPPAASVCVILLAVLVRLGLFHDRMMPIGFGAPLILFGWLRSRRYLHLTAAAFAILTLVKFLFIQPPGSIGMPTESLTRRATDTTLVLLDLLLITIVVDALIVALGHLGRRNTLLTATNEDLAARETEIGARTRSCRARRKSSSVRARSFAPAMRTWPPGNERSKPCLASPGRSAPT